MSELDRLDLLYVGYAFLFHLTLIIHFALRKWRFEIVQQYGWVFYALSLLAFVVSLALLRGGKPVWIWLGGFLYLTWAIFGYLVEYQFGIPWRNPIYWPVLVPYVSLYLATVMFYWWPLGQIGRPYWYIAAALFVISTVLNLASH